MRIPHTWKISLYPEDPLAGSNLPISCSYGVEVEFDLPILTGCAANSDSCRDFSAFALFLLRMKNGIKRHIVISRGSQMLISQKSEENTSFCWWWKCIFAVGSPIFYTWASAIWLSFSYYVRILFSERHVGWARVLGVCRSSMCELTRLGQ